MKKEYRFIRNIVGISALALFFGMFFTPIKTYAQDIGSFHPISDIYDITNSDTSFQKPERNWETDFGSMLKDH